MASVVANPAKGRVAEFSERVNNNDPSTAGFILIPLETSGIVSDATLIDYATVALMLAGATNEQTTMGRKTLTDADLAAITIDTSNDRVDVALPAVTWPGATGNAISKICVAYAPDTGGADSTLIPMTYMDFAITPDGSDVVMTAGTFFRAS